MPPLWSTQDPHTVWALNCESKPGRGQVKTWTDKNSFPLFLSPLFDKFWPGAQPHRTSDSAAVIHVCLWRTLQQQRRRRSPLFPLRKERHRYHLNGAHWGKRLRTLWVEAKNVSVGNVNNLVWFANLITSSCKPNKMMICNASDVQFLSSPYVLLCVTFWHL